MFNSEHHQVVEFRGTEVDKKWSRSVFLNRRIATQFWVTTLTFVSQKPNLYLHVGHQILVLPLKVGRNLHNVENYCFALICPCIRFCSLSCQFSESSDFRDCIAKCDFQYFSRQIIWRIMETKKNIHFQVLVSS